MKKRMQALDDELLGGISAGGDAILTPEEPDISFGGYIFYCPGCGKLTEFKTDAYSYGNEQNYHCTICDYELVNP